LLIWPSDYPDKVFKAVNTLQFKADNTISLKTGDHVYIDTRNVNIKSNRVLSIEGMRSLIFFAIFLRSNLEKMRPSESLLLQVKT
jgi:hypothetical protein